MAVLVAVGFLDLVAEYLDQVVVVLAGTELLAEAVVIH